MSDLQNSQMDSVSLEELRSNQSCRQAAQDWFGFILSHRSVDLHYHLLRLGLRRSRGGEGCLSARGETCIFDDLEKVLCIDTKGGVRPFFGCVFSWYRVFQRLNSRPGTSFKTSFRKMAWLLRGIYVVKLRLTFSNRRIHKFILYIFVEANLNLI